MSLTTHAGNMSAVFCLFGHQSEKQDVPSCTTAAHADSVFSALQLSEAGRQCCWYSLSILAAPLCMLLQILLLSFHTFYLPTQDLQNIYFIWKRVCRGWGITYSECNPRRKTKMPEDLSGVIAQIHKNKVLWFSFPQYAMKETQSVVLQF